MYIKINPPQKKPCEFKAGDLVINKDRNKVIFVTEFTRNERFNGINLSVVREITDFGSVETDWMINQFDKFEGELVLSNNTQKTGA